MASPYPQLFSPASPAPPCRWRLCLAAAYEAQHGPLPDPISTFGAGLVTAPPTPVLPPSEPPVAFATQLTQALRQVFWRQDLRRELYGDDAADTFRVGHTPEAVKARAATTAEDDDDGTTTEEDAPRLDMKKYMPTRCQGWRRSVKKKLATGDLHNVERVRRNSTMHKLPVTSPDIDWIPKRVAGIKRKLEDSKDDEVDNYRLRKRANVHDKQAGQTSKPVNYTVQLKV